MPYIRWKCPYFRDPQPQSSKTRAAAGYSEEGQAHMFSTAKSETVEANQGLMCGKPYNLRQNSTVS